MSRLFVRERESKRDTDKWIWRSNLLTLKPLMADTRLFMLLLLLNANKQTCADDDNELTTNKKIIKSKSHTG